MPTGPMHSRWFGYGTKDAREELCRCTIGEHHDDQGISIDPPDDFTGERLSDSDAEDIWLSSGMDEDYDFR